jgi:chromosome segregation ATPase
MAHREIKMAQTRLAEKDEEMARVVKERTDEVAKLRGDIKALEESRQNAGGEVSNMERLVAELKKLLNQSNREVYTLKTELEDRQEQISLRDATIAKLRETSVQRIREVEEKMREAEEVGKAKRIMLEDKAAEVEAWKKREQAAREEGQQLIDGMERQLREAQEDADDHRRNTKKVKEALASTQKELESLRQELAVKTAEVAELEAVLESGQFKQLELRLEDMEERLRLAGERERESKERAAELLSLVEELKSKLVARKKAFDSLSRDLEDQQRDHKRQMVDKETQIDRLRKQLDEATADVKVLVREIEDKKRQAQSNLTKLAQIFN